jgi:ketosteroid isomerase-like protein
MPTSSRCAAGWSYRYRGDLGDDLVSTGKSVADDIVWTLHGYKTLKGKTAFDAEIENEGFEGSPKISIDRLIEEGDSVVATGSGSVPKKGGEQLKFAFCEVFTFTGDVISRIDTYHIWLS